MSKPLRTPEQIAEHDAIHEWFSRNRPSREDLVASGDLLMLYKGYAGTIEIDAEGGVVHGRVVGLRDVVTFEGATMAEARKAFEDSVDDYLAFCRERGEAPDKPALANLARLAAATDGPIDTSDIPEATGPGRPVVRDAEGRPIPRNPIERLRAALATRFPDVGLDLDAPADGAATWHLDVRPGGDRPWVAVEWEPDRGFGVSTPGPDDYGTGPDELYADAEAALDRVAGLIRTGGRTVVAGRDAGCPLSHIPNAEAEAALRAADAIELSDEARDHFLARIDDPDATPNAALARAARRHDEAFEADPDGTGPASEDAQP